MRILIIHPENQYFAGAERMLGYFLEAMAMQTGHEIAVAVVPGSRVAALLPANVQPVWIEDRQAFSVSRLWRQVEALRLFCREHNIDIIHGWAARDWELSALTGWLCHRPAIGTLHDHPEASFISGKRRRLMRWCANHGLKRIICVSSAVQNECVKTGYFKEKLAVVHNALPTISPIPTPRLPDPFRIGFLGAFSERKGLRDLFQIIDELAAISQEPCEWHLAGSTQDENGERLLRELRVAYEVKSWWKKIHWHGWVESPQDFVKKIDLLITPSSEFEPFGLVLVEAGQAGVPVLATRVGGIPEIVVEGKTGWLFDPGNVKQAVEILGHIIIPQADLRLQVGKQAVQHIMNQFSAAKMVAEYCGIYSTFLRNV